MITKEGSEVWVHCDKCAWEEFGGLDAGQAEIRSLSRWGWKFAGGRMICPFCAKKAKVNA